MNSNNFVPRDYQLPLCHALEDGKYKRLLACWHRRAGKDVCAFNLMIRAAWNKIGVYYYIFPTYSQAKKVIWDSITSEGQRFLDYIPAEIIRSSNSQEMKIQLMNGSLIQLVGSDNVDSLLGTNPVGIVFSEYAMQDPRAYQFLRPILLVNDGWSLFISTPRGKNGFYDLYRIAQENPEKWFCSRLTIKDTGVISEDAIKKEIEEGLISEDLALQEYYVSFDMGIEGAYYTRYLDDMRLKGQIADVPWEPAFKVHTSWDLGIRDKTSVIFFQSVGTQIRIIDCYENSDVGLEHYAHMLQEKPYTYGKHIAPHDIKVRELGTGMSRLEKARQLGIKFIVAPSLEIADGIEAVRSTLPKIWIDQVKAKKVIVALENYRKEYDHKHKVYKPRPLHNEWSHMADSLRYLCISQPKTKDGMTQEDMDKMRAASIMAEHNHAAVFQQPTNR